MPAFSTAVAILAVALATLTGVAAERLVDPLTTTAHWQVGGRRINYTLGASSLAPSNEQVCPGAEASLKLTYDFQEPGRDYVSAYHTGEAIPGVCAEIAFRLYGDGSGRGLRLAVEDARGRWFQRQAGTIDWSGWKEVRVPLGDGSGWEWLGRLGEAALPLLHPANLRQIAVLRTPQGPHTGAVYLADLRAVTETVPADFVTAEVATDRPASRFSTDTPPVLRLTVANRGPQPVTGRLTAEVTDFFGRQTEIGVGPLDLAPDARLQRELRDLPARLGSYEVALRLAAGQRERVWFGRYVVCPPLPDRPADPKALFGCNFSLHGVPQDRLPTVLELCRDSGIRWERLGFGWGELNPAPGVWAWDGPPRTASPTGKALVFDGQSLRAAHAASLDITDAITVAFRARGKGANKTWQMLLQKWAGEFGRRNYAVYFHQDTGAFCFTASYAKLPGVNHHDASSGLSAWDGQWHHYAATYSSQAREVALYVDGQVRARQELDGGDLRTNADDLIVGGTCNADLDDLALFRRALAPAEVAALARQEPPPAAGLVAWWPFDNDGARFPDRSGNGHDLDGGTPGCERIARLATANGMKVLGLLGFPPAWASTAPADAARPWVHEPRPEAWAEFVEGVTRHYRDLVQHWEIWNEPNIGVFWEPQPDVQEYLQVLRTGYEAAKRGNPACTVTMPGLAGPCEGRGGMEFLDALLAAGGARWCDAISLHPYRQTTPEESDLAGDLRHIADLAAANGGRRPLWFTEECWTTQIPGGSSERRQALMLPRAYVLSLATGLMERFFWFRLHDSGIDRFYSEDNYGLCHNDLTPKPAWFAHRTVATLLEGATPDPAWDAGPHGQAYAFRTPAGRVAAVWTTGESTPVSVFVGAPRVTTVDLMGNEAETVTDEGVLLVDAGAAVVFLRDLPAAAEGRGAPLSVTGGPLWRGATAALTARLRNPFPSSRPLRATFGLERPDQGTLAPARIEARVPANSVTEVPFTLTVPATATPGWLRLRAEAEIGDRRCGQTLELCLRSAPPDAGPVAVWHLDEGQGTEFRDSSPAANHGQVHSPKWVPGRRGTALEFDGGPDLATVPDSPSLNLRDEVTLAFWLRLTGTTGTWQFPVTKYYQENVCRNYGVYLHKDGAYACFSASHEGDPAPHIDTASRTPLDDGHWHHLAASYSQFDRRVRLYVDGQLEADRALAAGPLRLTTDPVRLGGGTKAVLDEISVWPRALSPTEIADLAK